MYRQCSIQKPDALERLSIILFMRRREVVKSTQKLKTARRIGTQI